MLTTISPIPWNLGTESDIQSKHYDVIATYKTLECKKKFNHDKRQCMYWHSRADRRRNPFLVSYATTECSDSNCPRYESCPKTHNKLEKMFHPELFKISMCICGPYGSHCERGIYCAFAHGEHDLRRPFALHPESTVPAMSPPTV